MFPDVILGDGLFTEMENPPWADLISAQELDMMFFSDYGDRPIAPIFKMIPTDNTGALTETGRKKLATLLANRFKIPWDRRYQALIVEYPVLDTLLYDETTTTTVTSSTDRTQTDKKTGTETTGNTTERTQTDTKTGSDTSTNTTTYDTTDTQTSTETVDGESSREGSDNTDNGNKVYGFNSASPVLSDESTGTTNTNETTTNDSTTTTNSQVDKDGTEKIDGSITYNTTDETTENTSVDGTVTYDTTNTQTIDDDSTQTTELNTHKTGSSAVYTNQDVLQKEIDLWTKFDYFKTVFEDVAKVITLGIYQVDI